MNFNLTKIIVHEVIKEPRTTGSKSFTTKELLPLNESSVFFIQQLNRSFSRDNINYGTFKTESQSEKFRDEFKVLHENQYSEPKFIDFTVKLTEELSTLMTGIVGAKGGYLVYAEYTSMNVKYIAVYFVRDTERVLLQRDGDKFNVSKIENVDTDQLAMASRIVVEKYDKSVHGYLQFIKNRQERVSDYFLRWIAAHHTINSRELTDKFVEILEALGVGYKEDGEKYESIDDFHKAVTTYVNGHPNNMINLRDIGTQFYKDEEKLTKYAQDHEMDLDTEFRSNQTGLRKLYRLEFTHSSLVVKFSRGDWSRKTVKIVSDQVVISDKKLADKILAEFSNNVENGE